MSETDKGDIWNAFASESQGKVISEGCIEDSYDLLDDCDIMRWIIDEEMKCSTGAVLTSAGPAYVPRPLPVTSSKSLTAKRTLSEDASSSDSRRNSKKRRKLISKSGSLDRKNVCYIVQRTNVLLDAKAGNEGLGNVENFKCLNLAPHENICNGQKKCSTAEEQVHISEEEKYVLQIQRAMIADEDGDRPIHLAVAQENLYLVHRICTIMKNIDASLDLVNNLRQTPLHLAVIVKNPEITKFMLSNGSSVQRQDRHGRTAIHLSVKFFNEECFKILLDHNDSRRILDSLDYEGLSALHYAVLKGNVSAINGLYHAGANIDIVDGKSGRSALMHAIQTKDVGLVQLILKCGACVEKVDFSGHSVLDIANQVENKEIIQCLEKENTKELNCDMKESVRNSYTFEDFAECNVAEKQYEFTCDLNEIQKIINL